MNRLMVELTEKPIELVNLIGRKLINIKKYFFESYAEHIEYLDEVEIKDYRDIESWFKYGTGRIGLQFDDNTEYLFTSNEEINSIIYCKKSNRNKCLITSIAKSISVKSEFYSLLYLAIVKINILMSNNLNAKEQCVNSDQGLQLIFENETELFICHNLSNSPFDFVISSNKMELNKNISIKISFGKII